MVAKGLRHITAEQKNKLRLGLSDKVPKLHNVLDH